MNNIHYHTTIYHTLRGILFASILLSMHILQWNAQSITAHGDEFKKAVFDASQKPDIICIQESWLKEHHKFNLKNYNVVRKDRSKDSDKKGGGGVLTCIRNGLAYRVLDCESNQLEVLLVEIFQEDKSRVNIVNIYNPGLPIEKDEVSNILKNLNDNVIICGDLNGHNALWGSKKNDANGNVIIDIINDFNLVCLNDGSGTRIDRSTGKMSCLDLTLVSMKIAAKCTWVVGDDFWDSDHLPITTSTHSCLVNNRRKSEPKWSVKKANWDKFQSNCIHEISLPDNNDPTDDIYEQFIAELTTAIDGAIPKTSAVRQGKSPVPWWTDKCSEAIRDKKRALNRLKRSSLPGDYINYKKVRAIARKTIKEAKKMGWQEFCTNIDSKTSTRDVWNKLKCISKTKSYKGIPTLLDTNKQCVVTDREKANLLVQSFAAVQS